MVKTTTNLPKKHNATDGKKAHLDEKCYKVGRIKRNSWANKVLQAYDIIVYERELVHIQNEHSKELNALGLDAFNYIKLVVNNFTKIYQGTGNSVLLVIWSETTSQSAAIEIYLTDKNKFYKIKTAQPRNTVTLSKKKLLCANDH